MIFWKRGRLGARQMDLTDFNIKKITEKAESLSYGQDWSSYNKAKTKEKTLSLQLLLDLLEFFPDKVEKRPGRPSILLNDQIICMFICAYSRFSSRKCISDIEFVRQRKLIERTPHFNSVLNMFGKLSMTNVLSQLVEISSLPLRMFEEHLSVDSSGFSCSTFQRWFDIRTQETSKKREWMKAHLITGAKTNVIASIAITDGTEADCPELIPLVKKASKYFDMKEVSADKAYLSRENLWTIASVGAVPYIPFKTNSVGKPRGMRLWKTMYEYFYNNQEEFMKHYHQRSNIESTYSMIKRNFGHKLRMRNRTGQVNEILMKCLCHNLTVLVQEMFELGLEIDFNKCAEIYFAQKQD